jgi:hypothetical protein
VYQRWLTKPAFLARTATPTGCCHRCCHTARNARQTQCPRPESNQRTRSRKPLWAPSPIPRHVAEPDEKKRQIGRFEARPKGSAAIRSKPLQTRCRGLLLDPSYTALVKVRRRRTHPTIGLPRAFSLQTTKTKRVLSGCSKSCSISAQTGISATACRRKGSTLAGAFVEPSSGLEPETPSLPWRCSTN